MSFTFASDASASMAMRAASFSSAANAVSCSGVKSPDWRSSVSGNTRDSKRGPTYLVDESSFWFRPSWAAAVAASGSDIGVGMDLRRRPVYQLTAGERVLRRERTLLVD